MTLSSSAAMRCWASFPMRPRSSGCLVRLPRPWRRRDHSGPAARMARPADPGGRREHQVHPRLVPRPGNREIRRRARKRPGLHKGAGATRHDPARGPGTTPCVYRARSATARDRVAADTRGFWQCAVTDGADQTSDILALSTGRMGNRASSSSSSEQPGRSATLNTPAVSLTCATRSSAVLST